MRWVLHSPLPPLPPLTHALALDTTTTSNSSNPALDAHVSAAATARMTVLRTRTRRVARLLSQETTSIAIRFLFSSLVDTTLFTSSEWTLHSLLVVNGHYFPMSICRANGGSEDQGQHVQPHRRHRQCRIKSRVAVSRHTIHNVVASEIPALRSLAHHRHHRRRHLHR